MPTITSGDAKELFVYDWSVEDAVATVMLLHGYAEHAGRYTHVAEAFNAKKISLIAVDLRGHGRSPGDRGHVDRFSDYYIDATALEKYARDKAGEGPLFLFGHSMGGLLSLDWLLSGVERQLAGVILSSPFLGITNQPAIKVAAGKLLARLIPKFKLPLELAPVTRDPELQQKYENDALNNKKLTVRWADEALKAQERIQERIGQLSLPLLLLYGGDDKVVDVHATDLAVTKLTMKDREVDRLTGFYHELVNEPKADRDQVIDRMAEWILARAQA